MDTKLRSKFLILITWFLLSDVTIAAEIVVSGLKSSPLDLLRADAELGDNPVIGRLACPAFTRLNLAIKGSEGLIARNVELNKSQLLWKFELRTGIYWWSGKKLLPSEVVNFVEENLENAITNQGLSQWKIPAFKITANEKYVEVLWESKPEFGPFVLNGIPVHRKSDKYAPLGFECVGLYSLHSSKNGLTMKPTSGYPQRRKKIELIDDLTLKSGMRFSLGNSTGGNPWSRLSDEKANCDGTILQPDFSLIMWNLKSANIRKAEIRKSLTMLTPRGALLRSGTGDLGELVTSIIPRQHPGYNSSLKIRPHDTKLAMKAFDDVGIKRVTSDGYRRDTSSKIFEIRLVKEDDSAGIIEKVLIDAFAAVGIRLKLVLKGDRNDTEDGIITGVSVDWPQVNFLADLHSKGNGLFGLNDSSTNMDQLLLDYSKSLTFEKPDFSLLEKIHGKIYSAEPFTVIMQHSQCINVTNEYKSKLRVVDFINPDWFKRLSN